VENGQLADIELGAVVLVAFCAYVLVVYLKTN